MKKLIVDTKIHEEMGMKILNEDEVVNMPHLRVATNWPEDYPPLFEPFEPEGVTLEEARKAMEKCK